MSTSLNAISDLHEFVPRLHDPKMSKSLGYKTTRLMAGVLNVMEMSLAEAYINGLEIPDSTFRALLHGSIPILFKRFPGLLAPYEWVLTESDYVAESSRELMKVQYDLPQEMLNIMLGDWHTIYPKYSTGFWEHGATT